MNSRRLPVIWTVREGFAVLLAFALVYSALSFGHMAWVKYTVGFKAYLGDGPRMPPHLLLVSQFIKALVLVGVLWLVALHPRRRSWRTLGLVPCAPRWYALAVAASFLGFVLSLLLAKFMVATLPAWAKFAASRYAWHDGPALLMLSLVGMTIVVTPIAEEMFFRGFLFRWMASRHPAWLAIAASALMFGASHLIPSQAIVAALMSVFLTLLYLGSGSIWPSIVCHCVNNATGVLLGMAAAAGGLPAWLTP